MITQDQYDRVIALKAKIILAQNLAPDEAEEEAVDALHIDYATFLDFQDLVDQ